MKLLRDFKTLQVWEKSHQLALAVYQATAAFPKDEPYGLTSQMRRAAVSIPANIAEGCSHIGDAELARFLQISMGQQASLKHGFLAQEGFTGLDRNLVEVKRMPNSFLQKLRAK